MKLVRIRANGNEVMVSEMYAKGIKRSKRIVMPPSPIERSDLAKWRKLFEWYNTYIADEETPKLRMGCVPCYVKVFKAVEYARHCEILE